MKLLGDSKLTSKFQVTVPKSVRELLRLQTGDRLVFIKNHEQILVKKGRVKIEG